MTDVNRFTPSDATAAADTVKTAAAEKTKQAKEAVAKAMKSARETEKAKVGAAWTNEKAKVAHHAAEEHPVGLALGAFAIGLGVGFLIARNLD